MNEKITNFIDSNCRKCKKQKPLMKKAKCPMWHALDTKSKTAIDNLKLFVNEYGDCRYLELRED